MPRLAGVELAENKHIFIALTKIYGIGRSRSLDILKSARIDPATKVKDLTGKDIQALSKLLNQYTLEGELKKAIRDNIQRLKRTNSYRGLRHIAKLPSRGQRTRTNSRTLRGTRKTVGAMTKKARQKIETNK